MSEFKSQLEYIQEIRDESTNAAAVIQEAAEAFNNCVVEQQQGASKIVKEWGKMIKNTESELEKAYQYAEENGVVEFYKSSLGEGKNHRVCLRTFIVNAYIFNELKQANADSHAIDNMLSELEGGE